MENSAAPANEGHRILRVGALGLGRAFSLMAPTFVNHPRARLVAGADPRPEARELFAKEFQARSYESIEDLCADEHVDAVYISTPHHLHAQQTRIAAAYGKHILVEKPMGLTVEECRSMVEAARSAGVCLLVGHSHSFDAPIARTRALIASGNFGPLRMITAMNFTDFLYRPRWPQELDTEHGGGVVFNQAPHQVDIIRLLGGGRLSRVRSIAGVWDRTRRTQGAYAALFTFENDCCATLTYSGYAHFDSDEMCDWIDELGRPKDRSLYGQARRALTQIDSNTSESELKAARAYGGPAYAAPSRPQTSAHQHFGFVLASCEKADLRPTPTGVAIYADEGVSFESCPPPEVPRGEVVDELYAAIVGGHSPLHSGEWGLATMEGCLAILTSSREGREVTLSNQIGTGDD